MFIAVEGIDGSGKTEYCKILAKDFDKAVITAEPTTGIYGKQAREILKTHGDLTKLPELFVLDRKQHIKEIQNYLQNNITVICDRYVLSNLAYQSLEFPMEQMKQIAELNKNILIPDKTFFLDISPETALQRIIKRGGKREVFENPELLQKIRENYFIAINLYKNFCPNFTTIFNGEDNRAGVPR